MANTGILPCRLFAHSGVIPLDIGKPPTTKGAVSSSVYLHGKHFRSRPFPKSRSDVHKLSTIAVLAEPQAKDVIVLGRVDSTEASMGMLDTSLESSNSQRAWVATGAIAVLGMLEKAFTAEVSIDFLGIGLGAMSAYVIADLGTGIYHWAVDNYGDTKTPVFGSQIDAFQGHHQRPWTITRRQFANNIHALARPASFYLVPFLVSPSNPLMDSFVGCFLGFVVMSQQFHAWAHMKKSQLPKQVLYLQEKGILVSRKMHGAHHRAPYNVNYCIVSGWWNPLLDQIRFFPKLEIAIYERLGIAPRCWYETESDWLQIESHFEDGTDMGSS